jgi:cyclopropane-fatty-acyl-phospholipid synthase
MTSLSTGGSARAKASGASPEAIEFHYGVSNAFYEYWLGPTMVYSSAVFEAGEGDEALALAQQRKLDQVIDWAGAKAGDHVLEIGCGWGSMLTRLVMNRDVARATGLTLCQAQADWIARHPHPRIEVRLESWSEHEPSRLYDAIVSIEAMEAFVKPGMSRDERVAIYRDLFERCHRWLVPGGQLAIQTIAYAAQGAAQLDAFISTEVFPESDLPNLEEIAAASHGLFEMRTLVNEREQYVRTLRVWLRRFHAHRATLVEIVGEATVERYERYLKLCTYIFASGNCALYRFGMRRLNVARDSKGHAA